MLLKYLCSMQNQIKTISFARLLMAHRQLLRDVILCRRNNMTM